MSDEPLIMFDGPDAAERAAAWLDRRRGQTEGPPCPRCGEPMVKIASPDDYWDDAIWVWGCDCPPDAEGARQ